MILHVDKLPLYFLCSFCWYFHKIFWWFYFNEISNGCLFASVPVYSNLPVYYFDRNLPASSFIPPSPSIWNPTVIIDDKLTFEKRVDKLCRSASCQLNALFWLKNFLSSNQNGVDRKLCMTLRAATVNFFKNQIKPLWQLNDFGVGYMRKNIPANQDKKYKRVNLMPRLYREKHPSWTK